jgi:hypothetical protein
VPPAPRPHSPLGRLTVAATALALGVFGLVDLAGAPIPAVAYLAVALAVVGAGLVVGAWFGRARWLIAPGVVLALVLTVAAAVDRADPVGETVTWRPASIAELQPAYTVDVGNAVLDLSAVDLTGPRQTVRVDVGVGNLTVIVPATADVRASARVDVGNANVLGTRWAGLGQSTRTVTDAGPDGTGGGDLVVRATVDIGNLEVRR